jgi:hypothetical protein
MFIKFFKTILIEIFINACWKYVVYVMIIIIIVIKNSNINIIIISMIIISMIVFVEVFILGIGFSSTFIYCIFPFCIVLTFLNLLFLYFSNLICIIGY